MTGLIGFEWKYTGNCYNSLPATTLAVDAAFTMEDDLTYVVIRGWSSSEVGFREEIRKCAILETASIKNYPGPITVSGQYMLVVEKRASAGSEWKTYAFVPVDK